jgi:hypothetical protein
MGMCFAKDRVQSPISKYWGAGIQLFIGSASLQIINEMLRKYRGEHSFEGHVQIVCVVAILAVMPLAPECILL